MSNKGYEDLLVWQKAIQLSTHIYTTSKRFPKDELYGLTSQIRRSANSISANIAEGCARNSTGEFRQFLGIASGSVAETHTHLLIALNAGLLKKEDFDSLLLSLVEIRKMLNGLKASLT